ncbi:MAG: hypothetical protein ABIE74_12965 [Pseudomonadota bacterium]
MFERVEKITYSCKELFTSSYGSVDEYSSLVRLGMVFDLSPFVFVSTSDA